MSEKKYTAREAGIALLQKAESMMKKSSFAKPMTPPDGVVKEAGPHVSATGQPGPAQPQNPTPANVVGQDPQVPAGKHVTKGPIKLAKFVGRMEHKRSTKVAAPAPAAVPGAQPASPAPMAEKKPV